MIANSRAFKERKNFTWSLCHGTNGLMACARLSEVALVLIGVQSEESNFSKLRALVVRQIAWILMLFGLTIIFFQSYLANTIPLTYLNKPFVQTGFSGMNFIGSTLFIVGFVDILIEIPTFIGYINDRLREALKAHKSDFIAIFEELHQRDIDDKEFLARVSTSKLEKAHANIVRIISKADFKENGMFYTTLRRDIEPLLGSVHYESASFNITNKVIREAGAIYIESQRNIYFVFESHKVTDVAFEFQRTLRPLDGKDPSELFFYDKFEIDGDILLDRSKGLLDLHPAPDAQKDGNIRFSLDAGKRQIAPGQSIHVFRSERAYIPVTDVIMWRIRKGLSLRRLTVNCTFDEALYPHIYVNGFPGYENEPPESEKYCGLEWNGWMLPYHGFAIDWSEPARETLLASIPVVSEAI